MSQNPFEELRYLDPALLTGGVRQQQRNPTCEPLDGLVEPLSSDNSPPTVNKAGATSYFPTLATQSVGADLGETMPTERNAETYIISDVEAQRMYTGVRRAAQWGPFFLPHLRPGLSLLDCGCGVGSITLDLAEIVAPGRVVGLDLDEEQLAIARHAAVQCGLTNATFEQGSIYDLPFDNGTFDAVLALLRRDRSGRFANAGDAVARCPVRIEFANARYSKRSPNDHVP